MTGARTQSRPPLPELRAQRLLDSPAWLGRQPLPEWSALATTVSVWLESPLEQVGPLVKLIWNEARSYGRDPYFDAAVVCLESNFNPGSTSPAGALGLYQLMPDTAADAAAALGITGLTAEQLYQPALNVRLGAFLLDVLRRKYGSWPRALTAYNMGEGGLRRYERAHGDAQSVYARAVLALWHELRQSG